MLPGRRGLRALLGRRARLRWMHLLLGAALLMPFQLLTSVAVAVVGPGSGPSALLPQLLALALALPLVAAAGLLPVARSLEGAMARTLCGADGEILTAPADSWSARRRTSLWFTLHTLLGGITGALSLAVPPAGVLLLLHPLLGRHALQPPAPIQPFTQHPWLSTALGLGLLVLPVLFSGAAGRALARLAPRLLGPTPADRLAAARERADRMAERNRVARELHDSVGHALSVVGIQAAAAARLLRTDPDFAAAALTAIEETAHDAVAELDHVLGLLRDEEDRTAPHTLADLPALLDRARAVGAAVDYAEDGLEPATLPGTLSREAYRIVQEGLGNALKHADGAPVQVRLTVREDTLQITVVNPLRPRTRGRTRPRSRTGGGSGLTGMHERVRLLRGTLEAGPVGPVGPVGPDGSDRPDLPDRPDGSDAADRWRLAAGLPLRNPA
ncbi:sensor histidine kinase [Kitasatospora cineracea]|uniref:histidine kinase n=1 Tax=Kitasatospora cineracea TaxID=88074 RepID=A0A8G1ULG3_9ACTN|nr:histidine kinase [Kitasatospora cineracea]ROR46167.1 signal transduction histidine kinase [Kitasatospora cineracea]